MASTQKWIDVSQFLQLKKGEIDEFDYEDKRIMILNLNGEFCASDRICTHAYVDLTGGMLNESERTVTCPLHLSSFDLKTGTALNLPAEKPLGIYPMKKEKNKLLILI
jgi:3-phenylpropionate/trans-cinnamate dioxygenase ferredoxin component